MQTGLDPLFGVTAPHALLVPILVQQARGIL